MNKATFDEDSFMKIFGIADKIRQTVLHTSTSKKNIALFESMTHRQHKAMLAVLLLMEENPEGTNLKTLAERMSMTVPATSVLVESMVQNNIFLRVTSPRDRRAVCIKLSDFGMSNIENMRKRMNDYVRNLYLDLTDEDKAAFCKVINQLHEKLFPNPNHI
ncbi:MAG: MarR family transcriptional regulator [Thermoguttaceae bacterium]|nr:MarR family transcriptional regulator [Thermoguttaceae bacterium]